MHTRARARPYGFKRAYISRDYAGRSIIGVHYRILCTLCVGRRPFFFGEHATRRMHIHLERQIQKVRINEDETARFSTCDPTLLCS